MHDAMILLVHHGDALPPDVDSQRPLSPRGRHGAERLAAASAARGIRPAAVWHSGKLRARQTAEPFWRACNPLAEFAAIRGLQPTDPASLVADLLAGETRDLVLAGHMPNLERVLCLMTTGSEASPTVFPPHGVVALEPVDATRWREAWRLEDPRDEGEAER
jgi:phosphohistidine phosphatase